jgi:hypothetical protein
LKLTPRFKAILLSTLTFLYATGLVTWILSHWFFVHTAFGLERSPFKSFWMQIHAIIGLGFLVIFGYTIGVHVIPSWKRRKKRFTGALLTCTIGLLTLTVPGLFYITIDSLKDSFEFAHTYVGLASLGIFLLHYFAKAT